MKKILSIICLAGMLLSSCSDWLEVTPADSVIEQDLFKEATGFQNALNGVYESMSSKALYGTDLSFGMLDAMGQVYSLYGKNGSYVGIQQHCYYYQAALLKYDNDETIKNAFEAIWEQGYKVIANCNNIIKNIDNLPASKFMYGQVERDMIKGEALAARALMHFDLLRLFAPSPRMADAKLYIPYVTDFPYYGGQVPLSVPAVMEKIEIDLKLAENLVMDYDTMDMTHRELLSEYYRFAPTISTPSVSDGSKIDMNAFYFFRGYRLNGLAIKALLARFYSWWGDEKLKLAAEYAESVADFEIEKDGYKALYYTNKNVKYDRKFSKDLIFCLSYPLLQEDYLEAYVPTSSNSYLALGQYEQVWNDDLADGDDYRRQMFQVTDWDGVVPLKNRRPEGEKDVIKETEDMVPMIRLSEMHLIMAEYYASIGDFTNAAKMITNVRVGRNCKGDVDLGIHDMQTFKSRLLSEVRREYFQEGQTFFYYKKYGEPLFNGMNPDLFVVSKPDSENIN